MSAEASTILAVVIVSLISLIGVFTISINKSLLSKITLLLVSLAAGTLIGDVFLHIIPELYAGEETEKIGIYILVGIMGFFVFEKFLNWRHCHTETSEDHKHPIAINNLIADGLHNFVDGLIIAAAFLSSTEIGVATTIAIVLHEIPQEMGDFGVLIHAGFSKTKALAFNFLSAVIAVLGALIGLAIGEVNETAEVVLLAFAAGGFIYIAVADLIPEIKHEENLGKNIMQLAFVLIGIFAMYGLTFVEGDTHSHGHGSEESEIHDEDDHGHDHEDEEHHGDEEGHEEENI